MLLPSNILLSSTLLASRTLTLDATNAKAKQQHLPTEVKTINVFDKASMEVRYIANGKEHVEVFEVTDVTLDLDQTQRGKRS